MPNLNQLKQKLQSIGGGIQEAVGGTGGTLSERLKNTAKTVIPATANLAKDILLEYPARALTSTMMQATGQTELTPQSPAEKFVFGEESVKSLGQRITEATPQYGGSLGKTLAGVGVLGTTALDLTPIGGSRKKLAEELVNSKTIESTSNLLKSIGLSDDLIDIYAPKFTLTNTVKETNQGLVELEKLIKSTSFKPSPLSNSLRKSQSPLVNELRGWRTDIPETGGTTTGGIGAKPMYTSSVGETSRTGGLPKELENSYLIKEIQSGKYKTWEDLASKFTEGTSDMKFGSSILNGKEVKFLEILKLDDWSKAQGLKTPDEIFNTVKNYSKTGKFDVPVKTSLGEKIIQTGEQKPTIKLKRDVTVTTLQGEKVTIPEDEVLKAYESGGKALLKDGREYIVSKSQYENIKNNSLKSEAKEFAPELKTTEETVKGASKWEGDNLMNNGEVKANLVKNNDGTWSYQSDFSEGEATFKTRKEAMKDAEMSAVGTFSDAETKFSEYQLPGGKNYREIIVKAPAEKAVPGETAKQAQDRIRSGFRSSHFPDEKNPLFHLRVKEYDTEPYGQVTFMEELQSDWAREGRSKGFATPETTIPKNPKSLLPNGWKVKTNGDTYRVVNENDVIVPDKLSQTTNEATYATGGNENVAIGKAIGDARLLGGFKEGLPNHPLLKNWQELSVKRALKEAVDNNSEYLSWINGEQTAARYNLSKEVKEINWNSNTSKTLPEGKFVKISPNGGENINLQIDKTGKIISAPASSNMLGKKLDETIGKGISEKILAEPKGNLSGEGLNIGGEWAKNLYDKQVKNIVEDITGHKVEVIDMGLDISKKTENWYVSKGRIAQTKLTPENMKVGETVKSLKSGAGEGGTDDYIITDVLGDGKFKAVPKSVVDDVKLRGADKKLIEKTTETFDISTKKSAGQQAIKIDDNIRAMVKGESPILKNKVPLLPSKIDPLIQEAKKYKTAEEFIKSIDNQGDQSFYDSVAVKTETGKPIIIKGFHGTDKQFNNFIIPKEGVRYTGDGVYFYPNKLAAEGYILGKKGGRVIESYVDLKKPYNMYLPGDNIDWQPGNELLRGIKGKGYDGIIVRMKDIDSETGKLVSDTINEIVAFNPESIKTKSQLTDIFNKAHNK